MKPALSQVSEAARAYLAKHMTGGALQAQRRALYLADWHVPDAEQLDLARGNPDEELAQDDGDRTCDCDALEAEVARRGRLIEEQERDLDRLRSRVAELEGRC